MRQAPYRSPRPKQAASLTTNETAAALSIARTKLGVAFIIGGTRYANL